MSAALTAGQTALALSACTSSCTIGGVTYGYKSSSKTAGTLSAGPIGFTVTATDKASGATTGSFSVAVDNTAPTVTALAVATTTTSVPGWLRKSGAYNVYANATDGASGIFTVKANVSTITSGQTALTLSACTTGCTIGGVTYAYKSANKTASSSLAAGAVSFSVTATDNANNAGTTNGSATADNTAPTVSGAAIATVVTNVPGYREPGPRLRRLRRHERRGERDLEAHRQGEQPDHRPDGACDAGLRRVVQRRRRGPRLHERGHHGQRVAERRLQDLHADRDRQRRQHDHHVEPVGHGRQHRADRVDHVPDGRLRGRLGCRLRDGGRRRRLRHGDRRHRRRRHGAGQLPAVGGSEPLLGPGPRDVLVGHRGALERDPRAPVLVVPDGGGAFTNATGYTLRALATDAAGNTATTSTTFTFSP